MSSGLSQFFDQPPPQSAELISMGKRAAMDFINNGTPLTDAVVKEACDQAGITTEQVKRVVEQANTTAYLHAFEKKAGNKVIDFEIADPETVLSRLEGRVAPVTIKLAASEYSQPPRRSESQKLAFDLALLDTFGIQVPSTPAMQTAERTKTAGARGLPEDCFREVTQGYEAPSPAGDLLKEAVFNLRAETPLTRVIRPDLQKVASDGAVSRLLAEPTPLAEMRHATQKAYEKVAAHAEACGDTLKMAELRSEALRHDLAQKLAAHLVDGGSVGEMVHMMTLRGGQQAAKLAMSETAPEIIRWVDNFGAMRLKEEDLVADAMIYDLERSKMASVRQVDPTHPVVRAFDAFRDTWAKQAQATVELEEALGLLQDAEEQRNVAAEAEKRANGLNTMLHGAEALHTVTDGVKKIKGGFSAMNVDGHNPLAPPTVPGV